MNNAPAGPWWFTAVVAGITALATLLAGGLTTLLTLRYSNKRLAIEIKHQRSQEQHKLIFDQRVKLYTGVIESLEHVTRNVEDAFQPVTFGQRLNDTEVIGLRYLDLEIQKKAQQIEKIWLTSLLMSSAETSKFIEGTLDAMGQIREAIAGYLETGYVTELEYDEMVDTVAEIIAPAFTAMRKDIRVTDTPNEVDI